MSGNPVYRVSASFGSRKKKSKTPIRRDLGDAYEDSVGYRLATEGSATLSYQDLLDLETPQERCPSRSTIATLTTRPRNGSYSTMQSHYDPVRAPLAVSQQTSASAVRDMALRKGRPTIHDVIRQPGLDSPAPANTTETHARSQRLGLSSLFSRKKEPKMEHAALKKPMPAQSTSSPLPDHIIEGRSDPLRLPSLASYGSTTSLQQVASASGDIAKAATIQQNMHESTKVNVRRPRKGIQHWFDALDDSDEDENQYHSYAIALESPTESAAAPAFRPSLGPSRSRGAPTSRISPANEQHKSDYFAFEDSPKPKSATKPLPLPPVLDPVEQVRAQSRARNESRRAMRENDFNEVSVLALSSSSEDEFEPQTLNNWAQGRESFDNFSDISGQQRSMASLMVPERNPLRESTLSARTAQTTMTSGTIPIIHDEDVPHIDPSFFNRTPLPPTRSTRTSHSSDPIRQLHSQTYDPRRGPQRQIRPILHSRNQSDTSSSERESPAARIMAVTEEEMVLLEMMRRKRAAMQKDGERPSTALRQEPEIRTLASTLSRTSTNQSGSSSLITRSRSDSGSDLRTRTQLHLDSPDGTIFPTPPSSNGQSHVRPSAFRKGSYTSSLTSQLVTEEDESLSQRSGHVPTVSPLSFTSHAGSVLSGHLSPAPSGPLPALPGAPPPIPARSASRSPPDLPPQPSYFPVPPRTAPAPTTALPSLPHPASAKPTARPPLAGLITDVSTPTHTSLPTEPIELPASAPSPSLRPPPSSYRTTPSQTNETAAAKETQKRLGTGPLPASYLEAEQEAKNIPLPNLRFSSIDLLPMPMPMPAPVPVVGGRPATAGPTTTGGVGATASPRRKDGDGDTDRSPSPSISGSGSRGSTAESLSTCTWRTSPSTAASTWEARTPETKMTFTTADTVDAPTNFADGELDGFVDGLGIVSGKEKGKVMGRKEGMGKMAGKGVKRGSADSVDSVEDDVLAAWGALGGGRY